MPWSIATLRNSTLEAFLKINSRIFEVSNIISKIQRRPRNPLLLQLTHHLPFEKDALDAVLAEMPASFSTASGMLVGCLHFGQITRTSRCAITAITLLATR